MLKLRLKRCGRKRQPSYRIIAIDSRAKRDGRAIEELGFYNPMTKETRISISKVLKYLEYGAQPTETVRDLLSKNSV
uniref:Small ribosomal subunit protein bS16c n=1 Tax=Haptophyceae sp. NIES-3900 TaxID=2748608 RepID=A0A7R7AIE8_9EUKA|nr:ribosomal protein S16 [Haptophyceae sp. NIES-3900]